MKNITFTFKNCMNKDQVGNFDVVSAAELTSKEMNSLWGFDMVDWGDPDKDIEEAVASAAGIKKGERFLIRYNA